MPSIPRSKNPEKININKINEKLRDFDRPGKPVDKKDHEEDKPFSLSEAKAFLQKEPDEKSYAKYARVAYDFRERLHENDLKPAYLMLAAQNNVQAAEIIFKSAMLSQFFQRRDYYVILSRHNIAPVLIDSLKSLLQRLIAVKLIQHYLVLNSILENYENIKTISKFLQLVDSKNFLELAQFIYDNRQNSGLIRYLQHDQYEDTLKLLNNNPDLVIKFLSSATLTNIIKPDDLKEIIKNHAKKAGFLEKIEMNYRHMKPFREFINEFSKEAKHHGPTKDKKDEVRSSHHDEASQLVILFRESSTTPCRVLGVLEDYASREMIEKSYKELKQTVKDKEELVGNLKQIVSKLKENQKISPTDKIILKKLITLNEFTAVDLDVLDTLGRGTKNKKIEELNRLISTKQQEVDQANKLMEPAREVLLNDNLRKQFGLLPFEQFEQRNRKLSEMFNNSAKVTPWQLLGIREDATRDEIEKAYQQKAPEIKNIEQDKDRLALELRAEMDKLEKLRQELEGLGEDQKKDKNDEIIKVEHNMKAILREEKLVSARALLPKARQILLDDELRKELFLTPLAILEQRKGAHEPEDKEKHREIEAKGWNLKMHEVDKFRQDARGVNPWDILGVPKDASEQEIRAAYKKKCIELSPDKNQLNADKFKLLNPAQDILLDKDKRLMFRLPPIQVEHPPQQDQPRNAANRF